jgi:hypothetical protein
VSTAPGQVPWRALAGLAVVVALASGASQWWRSHLAGSLGEQLVALARPGDIQRRPRTHQHTTPGVTAALAPAPARRR